MLILVTLTGLTAFAAGWGLGEGGTTYESKELGFRFAPSLPVPAGQVIATFHAEASAGFSPNVNVVIQAPMERAAYRQLSLEQFEQNDLELVRDESVTVSGHDALRWEYRGSMTGRALRFASLAVFTGEHTYLVTATATPEQFQQLASHFDLLLASFELINQPR